MPYLTFSEPDGGHEAVRVLFQTMEDEGYDFVSIRQGYATYDPLFRIPRHVDPVYVFHRPV